jgi:DNA-3-methyladenine glycosylase
MPEFLDRPFFRMDPCTCAAGLIGSLLVWDGVSGRIVETEAYASENDEACHTFARKGARAFVERHDAGTAYVYLNYGVHWLLNVLVKGEAGNGFVLIRALEPVSGLETMRKRRRVSIDVALCSGPGKLTKALGVAGRHHGIDLCSGKGRGFVAPVGPVAVESDIRIGISRARSLEWRFLLSGSRCISVPRRKINHFFV